MYLFYRFRVVRAVATIAIYWVISILVYVACRLGSITTYRLIDVLLFNNLADQFYYVIQIPLRVIDEEISIIHGIVAMMMFLIPPLLSVYWIFTQKFQYRLFIISVISTLMILVFYQLGIMAQNMG